MKQCAAEKESAEPVPARTGKAVISLPANTEETGKKPQNKNEKRKDLPAAAKQGGLFAVSVLLLF